VEGEPADLEIIPSENARALAAYIMSLRADVGLFEAPLPAKPKPAGADTNAAPASATNAQPAGGAPAANPTAPSANPGK
jgi:hypothetical protein